MKKSAWTTVFFILLIGAAAADNSLPALLSRSGYAGEDARAVNALFEKAAAEKLPESFLLPRLEEGIAKRIPAPMMRQVLERELKSFLAARRVLESVDPAFRPETDHAVWQRAALCLTSGMPENDLGAVAGAAVRRRPDFRAAAELYLTLSRWGLEADDSRRIVVGVLGSRLAGEDFAGITAIFARGRARYLTTRTIADRVLHALPRAATKEDLANGVLY